MTQNNEKICSDSTTVCLLYYNGRGRAEPIRYLFAHAEFPFEDERVGLKDWDALKPHIKLGQLPIIKLKNKKGEVVSKAGQSGAILRSYAMKLGYAGKNPEESFLADEIYECTRDLVEAAEKLMWEFDPVKKEAAVKELKGNKIARFLAFFEETLKEHGGKFIAGGDQYTYADFAIACMLENWQREEIVDLEFQRFDLPVILPADELVSAYPMLAALQKNVEESHGIKAYLSKRPETPF